MGFDRAVYAAAVPERQTTYRRSARGDERDPLHRDNRVPMGDAAEGFPAVLERSATLLRRAG